MDERELVYGNVIRKTINPTQDINYERHKKAKTKPVISLHDERSLSMNVPFVITLTIATIITLGILINYLQVQVSITSRMETIASMERDLEALQCENDLTQTRINTSIDLDYVYKVATEELGMRRASEDQIVIFERSEHEYVIQEESIPLY